MSHDTHTNGSYICIYMYIYVYNIYIYIYSTYQCRIFGFFRLSRPQAPVQKFSSNTTSHGLNKRALGQLAAQKTAAYYTARQNTATHCNKQKLPKCAGAIKRNFI